MDKPPQISVSATDWQRTPLAVQMLVVSLWDRVGHLEQVAEQQAARIAALKTTLARRQGRGRRGAQNSSEAGVRPARQSGRRRSSGRSPGGQPGHEGHGRSLLSVEQVDELVP